MTFKINDGDQSEPAIVEVTDDGTHVGLEINWEKPSPRGNCNCAPPFALLTPDAAGTLAAQLSIYASMASTSAPLPAEGTEAQRLAQVARENLARINRALTRLCELGYEVKLYGACTPCTIDIEERDCSLNVTITKQESL